MPLSRDLRYLSVSSLPSNFWSLPHHAFTNRPIGQAKWSKSLVHRVTGLWADQHEDALAAWAEDECTYILRKAKDDQVAPLATFADSSSDDLCLVHTGGTMSAVWTIGRGVFCKVKTWDPKMESEDKTIAFVKKIAPQIATPNVIYTWIEHDRSFLILRRIEGSSWRDTWASLSLSQRQSLVETIAIYCDLLAQNTSKKLGTATGRPVLEPYLSLTDSEFVGPLTQKECESYFSTSLEECPAIEKDFHFYHSDLGPSNIIISNGGNVAGILDWESAGYYPAFWIATKPTVAPAFNFDPQIPKHEEHEWRKRLRDELVRLGYSKLGEWYMRWFRSRSST